MRLFYCPPGGNTCGLSKLGAAVHGMENGALCFYEKAGLVVAVLEEFGELLLLCNKLTPNLGGVTTILSCS